MKYGVRSVCCVLLLASAPVRAQPAPEARPPGYACVTAHPVATQACIDVLAAGGNAFDAAVAASATIAVAEPTGSGIGGGGFWLLHRASDGHEVFVDGRETAPRKSHRDMYLDAQGVADPKRSRDGALAAAIPGEPAALAHIAQHYGSKPLAELLAPAIRSAREGFTVDWKLARAISEHWTRLSPAARSVLGHLGQPLREGERLVQKDLAVTLERLAQHGRAGFYEGETARRLLAAVGAAGGLWTEEDFRRYKVVERAPVETWFRGYRIVTAPPPSASGVTLAQFFQQLEASGYRHGAGVTGTHLIVESWRRAYRDRAQHLGDPDFVPVPLQRLLSRSHALGMAANLNRARATPSSALPPTEVHEGGSQTTHLSVLDAQGNRAAATLSLNFSFGSGYMAPGTGVLLNNEMDDFAASTKASNAYGLIGSSANAIAPGKRPLSSMTPTFVEGPRGLLAIGTPGGSRIITMVALGILEWIGGASTQQLVAAPRFHHQYLPDEIQFEPEAFDADTQARLVAMGHALKPLATPYGNLHAIWWEPRAGWLEAAADPRGVGEARVVLSTSVDRLSSPRK
jgi:gamma-glutamyltranspeptidase / glutathione hydrolase